jgi:hypothetical protein
MSLTYSQQDALATDTETFNRRVTQAAISAALAVMAEPAATDGHTERAALAYRVLNYPLEQGRLMARAALTNACVGTGVTDPLDNDDSLLWVVTTNWNAFAGYTPS